MKGAKVRRLWADWPVRGEDKLHAYKWTSSTKMGFHYTPVAVVDMRKESFEALVEKAAQAAMNWERNRYGRLGNSNTETYRMQARAVLVSLFGPLPGGKKGATTRRPQRRAGLTP